ncbi:MAG: glycosyltransferase family 4 protein [Nitrospinaceae bacterium]
MDRSPNKFGILSLQYFTYPDAVGGAWGLTFEVNKRLVQRGYEVCLVTCSPSEYFRGREVIEGVQFFRVSSRDSKNIFRLWRALRKRIHAVLDRSSIQTIHIHNPLVGFLALMNRRLWPIPKVYHFHSSWYDEEKINQQDQQPAATLLRLVFSAKLALRLRLIRFMEWTCYFASRNILFLSEYSRERFLKYYPWKKPRLSVIPGGVDVREFCPPEGDEEVSALRRELGFPADRPILLTVRRLEARMGLENLVLAAARVVRQNPDLPFLLLIAGKGPLAPRLEGLIREHQLEDRVRLVGLVPRNRLPDHYRCADVFLLPTTFIEGFGLATVEALACGVPVLGTPVGGTVEILSSIDKTLLLRGTEPEDIADGMEGFLKNPQPILGLKSRCREAAVSRYSWELVVDRLEKEFPGPRPVGDRS